MPAQQLRQTTARRTENCGGCRTSMLGPSRALPGPPLISSPLAALTARYVMAEPDNFVKGVRLMNGIAARWKGVG